MASLLYLIVSMIGLTIHRDHEPQIHWETVDKASSCRLDVEENGSVTCVGDFLRVVCDIECDHKFQGAFNCTPERGWSSKLPDCVRELKEGDERNGMAVLSGERHEVKFGCPDEVKCIELCRVFLGTAGSCVKDPKTGKKTTCSCQEPRG